MNSFNFSFFIILILPISLLISTGISEFFLFIISIFFLKKVIIEKKWEFFNDKIVRKINEENYPDLNKAINIENRNLIIKNSWKTWQDSILGIGFDKLNSGPPSSSWIKNKKVISGEQI